MAIVPCAQAQRQVAITRAPAGRMGTVVSRGGVMRSGFAHLRRGRRFFRGSGFGAYYYPDYDYPDYDSEAETVEAPPPRLVAERAAEPAATAPAPKPAESLVIELQGDRWVRITNFGQSQTALQSNEPERSSDSPSALPAAASRRAQMAEPVGKLPPAVIVFRDGHTEEIGKYMIKGAALYTNADYWNSGSWTRKVPIAELDISTTLKANQERGAKFSLPSGPNEVMVRP
jgi:hypothetical protein